MQTFGKSFLGPGPVRSACPRSVHGKCLIHGQCAPAQYEVERMVMPHMLCFCADPPTHYEGSSGYIPPRPNAGQGLCQGDADPSPQVQAKPPQSLHKPHKLPPLQLTSCRAQIILFSSGLNYVKMQMMVAHVICGTRGMTAEHANLQSTKQSAKETQQSGLICPKVLGQHGGAGRPWTFWMKIMPLPHILFC